MQIRTRLFVALALTTAAVVIATLAVTRWSIEQGFEAFVEERQRERIERLEDALADYHDRNGTLASLATDSRAWTGLLMGASRPPRPAPANRQGQPGSNREDRPRRRLFRLADTVPDGEWPPRRLVERFTRDNRPLVLELRTMLLGADDEPLRVLPELLPHARRYPVEKNGEVIGTIALAPGPSISDTRELQFLQRQRGVALVTGGVALVLSAIVALWLASRFTRPLRTLQQVARQLAEGDYAQRSGLRREDELGQLAADVDALAEALASHERSRRQWVADIAHELRTPIAVMRAELEALEDGVRTFDERAIRSLGSDVLRLGRLVDDLHEVAMTDLGNMTFRFEVVDLRSQLEDDVDAFATPFARAGLAIETAGLDDASSGPLEVRADPGRLAQLVRNLLRNSLHHTDAPGTVRVSLEHDSASAVIRVEDTSPGVPDEALPRLFDRLYRADPSRSRAQGGAGLGLTICSNIAHGHGGSLSADHSPLGGLRVTLRLPLVREAR